MTNKQTDKQNGMIIRLTLCKRDAITHAVHVTDSDRECVSPVLHYDETCRSTDET